MKSALVTGGLGFLGSHLIDSLLASGYQVTIVDSLISNVVTAADYPQCRTIEAPIENVMDQLMPDKGARFDEIYHLASVVGPAGVLKWAGAIAKTVINSSEAVTELALAHKARLLLVSTSEVYGHAGNFHESDSCLIPSRFTVRLEYAVAKLTSEIAAVNRGLVTDLEVNIVRPFNIAGPRQLPGGGFVLPRFTIAALTQEPLTVFGDGTQVRAFTDVRDIVSGLRLVMASQFKSKVFNLGNPDNELAIIELARRVVKHTSSSSKIIHVDPKVLFGPLYEEGFDKVPVATTAKEMLGWTPLYSVEDTIQATREWFEARPHLLVPLDEASKVGV